jgi:hypothetical protein
MKRLFVPLLSICAVVLITSRATQNFAQTTSAPYDSSAPPDQETAPGSPAITEDWPLTFNSGGMTYSIFAPQCDSWNGHDFIGRSAVAVRVPGQSQPIYGTIGLNAITLVDKNTRTAGLADIRITSASFPTARSQTQSYLAALRGLPQREPSLSLDRVQGSLTLTPPAHTQRLNNTPPIILTASRPAVLVSIDGPPVWKPVPGTSLEQAINTRVLLFRDASGRYYLHLFDGYLQANSLDTRNWRVTAEIPDGAALAQEQALAAGNVDLMSGSPDTMTGREPSLSTSAIPDVFVVTTPAELITFSGAPEYVPISGTDLLYADNTSGNVFKLLTDQENYILLAGRWYRAPSLNGPWQFVPGNELPRDFGQIPDTSPKENVKASVPGTSQAQEALIANSIPQSAAVPLKQQMQNPQLDGSPQLAPIEGTPLQYVVNSETPIIEVGLQSWYACQDGVWYFSTSVNGPWSVATSVPPVIYTIPTSSPLHYLTYVQVYGSAPNDVYEGYTPGYLGTDVADDDTVVYGSGYNYQPWIGSVWYCPPQTWGYGFGPSWTPWWGWGFNSGFGWGCGYPGFGWWACNPPFPFWGGYRGFHRFGFGHHGWGREDRDGLAHTGVNFYHRGDFARAGFRNQFAESRIGAAGIGGGFGRAYNSRTGQLAGGQWAGVQNVHGSMWNSSFRSGGFVGRPAFPGVARPMTPAPNIGWSRSVWNNGYHPYAHYYSPRAWGNYGYRNYGYRSAPAPSYGWHGGSTRSGGWSQGGGGGEFHGGGESHMGGGFHGGGGRGFHGGGGGGFGGGGHGGR